MLGSSWLSQTTVLVWTRVKWISIFIGSVLTTCLKCEKKVFPFYNKSQIINCNTSLSQPSATLLKILYLNAKSLIPKIDELCLCGIEKFDVICVSET